MAAVAIVAQIQNAIQVLGSSPDPSAAAVAGALHRMLTIKGITFETAIGLAPGWRGCVWQTKRDTAIRAIARYYPGVAGRPQARAIIEDAGRYQVGNWESDRATGHRPDRLKGHFFDLLNIGPLPSEETVRKLLGMTVPPEYPTDRNSLSSKPFCDPTRS